MDLEKCGFYLESNSMTISLLYYIVISKVIMIDDLHMVLNYKSLIFGKEATWKITWICKLLLITQKPKTIKLHIKDGKKEWSRKSI